MDRATDRNELANVIRGLHKKLRKEFRRTGNVESLWMEHMKDENKLKEYAVAMHLLATKHWQNLSVADPKTSRIYWTRNVIDGYFFEGGLEKRRRKNAENQPAERCQLRKERIRVLDVGSCYNPFAIYSDLDIVAVDLCPAIDSVYQCDFLNVPVDMSTREEISSSSVISFKLSSFDVVIFSLLLEYLPSSFQRWAACKKACSVLKDEGLLVIITPDSKAAHANSKVMKSWRTALSFLGMERIAYEKLLHVHCMAFRKSVNNANHEEEENAAKMMYIPQDLQEDSDSDNDQEIARPLDEEISDGFALLPNSDCFTFT